MSDKEDEETPKVMYTSPLATPIITDKLLTRSLKLLKKAVSEKATKRGVPECTKAIRKGGQGIMFLAADMYPMDLFAHLPILCEEKNVHYCYVPSRYELGNACQTKRPVSALLVQKPKDDSTFSKTFEQVQAGIAAIHPYM
eukprot:TRINITY_DN2590_c0_g1_i1.p1 TRINITY_DN2590_c0_g1~~TRINITY_DN2590_c0_g1_i1.p1  ORF type:complete len:141 (+),score=28.80 TRINITY_DN2590_c0_g1_i1:85-507(+)